MGYSTCKAKGAKISFNLPIGLITWISFAVINCVVILPGIGRLVGVACRRSRWPAMTRCWSRGPSCHFHSGAWGPRGDWDPPHHPQSDPAGCSWDWAGVGTCCCWHASSSCPHFWVFLGGSQQVIALAVFVGKETPPISSYCL